MRRLFVASVLAAGLAGAFAHPGAAATAATSDNNQPRRRKTLGFGPVHSHAVYRSGPIPTANTFADASLAPLDVAHQFITDLTRDSVGSTSTFRIRKDTYTDKNTGVTHVYARQYINGVEVTDGDISVNVKDGIVLSYGDSVSSHSDAYILITDVICSSTVARTSQDLVNHQLQ